MLLGIQAKIFVLKLESYQNKVDYNVIFVLGTDVFGVISFKYFLYIIYLFSKHRGILVHLEHSAIALILQTHLRKYIDIIQK